MDEKTIDANEVAQLARLALAGKPKDVQLYVRRLGGTASFVTSSSGSGLSSVPAAGSGSNMPVSVWG